MYQAENKTQTKNPQDLAPVWIADRQTWVSRCEWDGAGGRCYRAAMLEGFCEWHNHCLSSGTRADSFDAFSKWIYAGNDSQWDAGEVFQAITGEVDPYADIRANFGFNRYHKESQNPEHSKINREFIKALSHWMANGKEAGEKRMGELAEAYQEHAANFLMAGRQINPEEVK